MPCYNVDENFKMFDKTHTQARNFLQVNSNTNFASYHIVIEKKQEFSESKLAMNNFDCDCTFNENAPCNFKSNLRPIADATPQNVPDGSLIDSLNPSSPKNRRRFVFGREPNGCFCFSDPHRRESSLPRPKSDCPVLLGERSSRARVDVILFRGRHTCAEPILLVSAIKFANCETAEDTCGEQARELGIRVHLSPFYFSSGWSPRVVRRVVINILVAE